MCQQTSMNLLTANCGQCKMSKMHFRRNPLHVWNSILKHYDYYAWDKVCKNRVNNFEEMQSKLFKHWSNSSVKCCYRQCWLAPFQCHEMAYVAITVRSCNCRCIFDILDHIGLNPLESIYNFILDNIDENRFLAFMKVVRPCLIDEMIRITISAWDMFIFRCR